MKSRRKSHGYNKSKLQLQIRRVYISRVRATELGQTLAQLRGDIYTLALSNRLMFLGSQTNHKVVGFTCFSWPINRYSGLSADVYGRPEMTSKCLGHSNPDRLHMFWRNGGQVDVVSTYWAELFPSAGMLAVHGIEGKPAQAKKKFQCQSEVCFELRPFP